LCQSPLYEDLPLAGSIANEKTTNPAEDKLLFVVIYSYFTALGGVNGENIVFLCSVLDY